MKNLENIGVQELNATETKVIEGGIIPALLIAGDFFLGGVAAGFIYELIAPAEIRERQ